MNPVRAVVVGAGNGAGEHLRALHELGCAVVAVVTRDSGRIAAVRRLFPDAEVCWPAAAALDIGGDLAVVASPAGTHLEIVTQAAERGYHVVVEKPLDARLDRAARIPDVTGKYGVGLAVCLQHRLKPTGVALRAHVAGGGVGAFTGGGVTVPWWRPASYYAPLGRGGYERDGGGVLITQAVHALDLFVSVVGPPVRVRAHATRTVQAMEAEDTVTAVLDYGAGRLAQVHATVAAYPGREEELWIAGTEGSVLLRGGELIRFRAPGADPETVLADRGASTAVDPSAMPTAWHRALLEDALDAFRTGREPVANARSALVTQRVVAAVYRSAARGDWVAPDDPVLLADPLGNRPL